MLSRYLLFSTTATVQIYVIILRSLGFSGLGLAFAAHLSNIERVSSLRVLGITLNDKLTAADHVTALLSSGSSMLYAMRVLRSHGTPTTSLQDIFRSTVISRILYAAPSWSGMCSGADHVRLDSLLRRSKRLGYCISDTPVISELFNTADDDIFQRVKTNSNHVLQPYLPQHTVTPPAPHPPS